MPHHGIRSGGPSLFLYGLLIFSLPQYILYIEYKEQLKLEIKFCKKIPDNHLSNLAKALYLLSRFAQMIG